MTRHQLTDQEWDCIADVFPAPAQTGRPPRDRRTIVDAILWILRTGSPWRDLPEEYQPWGTVRDLFDKWNADGTLDEILRRLRAMRLDGDGDSVAWPVALAGDKAYRADWIDDYLLKLEITPGDSLQRE